jgi:hypothetical protein
MNTKNKFLELKNELQKNATFEQYEKLSEIYSLFLDYGTEKFTEGLNKGSEIVKRAYKL